MSIKQLIQKNIFFFLLLGIIISLSGLIIRVVLNKKQYITVEIIVSGGDWWQTLPKTPYWLADPVKSGDYELTLRGAKLAEILETKKYEEGINKILWVKVKLLVAKDISGNEGWRFQQQPLSIGSTISIQPNSVKLTGNVIAIDDGSLPFFQSQIIIVTLKSYLKKRWFSDAIHIGDISKDDSNNIYAEIIGKSVSPSELSMPTKDGKIVSGKDPLNQDITLTIKLQTLKINGQLYFNRVQPVKIGNRLWLSFPTYNIDSAEIIDIK